jgi:archaeosine synthase
LFKTLASLGELRREVHLVTVSEPFALVPEEFYGRRTKWHDWGNSWYDCPGLFSWWCRKHNQPYRLDYVEKCIDILSDYVAGFFRRTRTFYKVRIAFVRTCTSSLRVTRDHTHLAIIKRASEKSGIDVDIQPPKEVVKEIVARYGRLAWDYRGISHSLAQEYLKSLLLAKLGG